MEVFKEAHGDANIDYLTIYIWAKNWGWFSKGKLAADFPAVVAKATAYIDEHVVVARRLNTPLVIEEFGLPRDEKDLSPQRRGDAEMSGSVAEIKTPSAQRSATEWCHPISLSASRRLCGES
jgi:hypothetical protein